jgi:N-acetylglucosamine kinase-like BadF-type ATPase
MSELLAVDAGGTSTRAVVVDAAGRTLGYGRSTGGNPTSAGVGPAVEAVTAAAAAALAAPGVDPAAVGMVLLAHAGSAHDFHDRVGAALAPLGVAVPVTGAGDVTALFASGTPEPDGAALIAGTGAIGGAIRGGALVRTVDGTGWLLGDEGSGFWIGHRVARAVVDDLDGGPGTALTPAVLARLGIAEDAGLHDGRSLAMGTLVRRLYAMRPVQLSSLAPLTFALREQDAVADAIVRGGVVALSRILERTRRLQPDGPVVLGGSVLVEGYLRLPPDPLGPLTAALGGATPLPVSDGLVGAAVLGLRASGTAVDRPLFERLSTGIAAAAAAWVAAQ